MDDTEEHCQPLEMPRQSCGMMMLVMMMMMMMREILSLQVLEKAGASGCGCRNNGTVSLLLQSVQKW
jgi:hypothetical protein